MSENEFEIPGFRRVTGEEFARMQVEAMDRQHMAVEDFKNRVNRFLDEMKADDAFTFFQMLIQMTRDTSMPDFYAGQTAFMLRRIHNVCTACGKSYADHEDHNILKSVDPEHNLTVIPEHDEDPIPLEDLAIDVADVPNDNLDELGLMLKYRVHPHLGADGGHAVKCKDCEETFKSLEFRIQQGLECPICAAKKDLDSGSGE